MQDTPLDPAPRAQPVRWHPRRASAASPHISGPSARHPQREARAASLREAVGLLGEHPALRARLERVMRYARSVRASEYHLTNACNIRCEGCWFFAHGHDSDTREVKDLAALEAFVVAEVRERRINTALVIGGEPTLFPERLAVFARHMRHLSISTNGLKPLPVAGFENVAVGITLFGGGPLDDALRGILPSGRRFTGLFEQALENWQGDRRAGFVYALTEDGIDHIEDTVRRIAANGNTVAFNFYSRYGAADPAAQRDQQALLAEALRVQRAWPRVVVSHPYQIEAMITGRSHWGEFGYDECPSISRDHPAHAARLANGNPTLGFFNTWAADLATLKSCCTSGHCNGCRDSQAVNSWLLVNLQRFANSAEQIATWVDIAEHYWRQFIWSPFHPRSEMHAALGA